MYFDLSFCTFPFYMYVLVLSVIFDKVMMSYSLNSLP